RARPRPPPPRSQATPIEEEDENDNEYERPVHGQPRRFFNAHWDQEVAWEIQSAVACLCRLCRRTSKPGRSSKRSSPLWFADFCCSSLQRQCEAIAAPFAGGTH